MKLNPITAIKQAVQLLQIRSRATAVLDTAQEAEKDTHLYRDARWWSRLMRQGYSLMQVLPIPQEIKDMAFVTNMLTNWKTTLGGIAALAAAVSAVANDPAKISDPVVLGLFGAAWAAFNSKDQNVTGGTRAATPEAKERVGE